MGASNRPWGETSLGSVATVVNGGTPTAEAANWDGDVSWATPADMRELRDGRFIRQTSRSITRAGLASGSAMAPAGSVLLSNRAPIGYIANVDNPVAFNQGCKAVIPSAFMVADYLAYVLLANVDRLEALGQGTTFKELSASALKSLRVPLPPPLVQREVARFLDRETAVIDSFIADQEQLIALLVERRTATISHVTTKGLDRDVSLRKSGVVWLGAVPTGWRVTRLSRFYRVTLGKMLDAKQQTEDQTLYVRAGNITEAGLDLADLNTMTYSSGERAQFDLRAGDLLVVEGGAIGVNVALDEDLPGICFQKTVNRVRPILDDSARFLGYQLDVARWAGAIDMLANKSTIAHFTAEKLERLPVALPTPAEQGDILRYLDHETSEIDAAIADAREAIALSKERRAALISAAVTGQIDVTDRVGASV